MASTHIASSESSSNENEVPSLARGARVLHGGLARHDGHDVHGVRGGDLKREREENMSCHTGT